MTPQQLPQLYIQSHQVCNFEKFHGKGPVQVIAARCINRKVTYWQSSNLLETLRNDRLESYRSAKYFQWYRKLPVVLQFQLWSLSFPSEAFPIFPMENLCRSSQTGGHKLSIIKKLLKLSSLPYIIVHIIYIHQIIHFHSNQLLKIY